MPYYWLWIFSWRCEASSLTHDTSYSHNLFLAYAFYGRNPKMGMLLAIIILAGQAASTPIILLSAFDTISVPSPLPHAVHAAICLIARSGPRLPFHPYYV
jgi:hypothetical protein